MNIHVARPHEAAPPIVARPDQERLAREVSEILSWSNYAYLEAPTGTAS